MQQLREMNSTQQTMNAMNATAARNRQLRQGMQQLLTKSFTDDESTEYTAAQKEVNRQ